MATRYLNVADVIAIHIRMMEGMGEQPSLMRDEGLIESAVLKPQMAAHYEDADLVHQAAVLGIGISQNQPFIDGNKRTAYMAITVFLRANGHAFVGEPLDLARELEAVAMHTDSLDAATGRFEAWLRGQIA